MLYIGEKVGLAHARAERPRPVRFAEVDIAVDPLEGTNLCATGAPNAIAVLAASERAACCTRPISTWRSWSSGPSSKDAVSLDAPVARQPEGDRPVPRPRRRGSRRRSCSTAPRHEKLIDDIRATGARIRLIGDGDLSAGIAAAVVGSGVHAVMGTGGAPEGVLTAAAMRCLNGEIFARLVVTKPEHEAALPRDGHHRLQEDLHARRISRRATSIIFAATGVTDGTLMRGVRFFGDGTRTSSVIMQNDPHRIRFIDSIHVEQTRTSRSGSSQRIGRVALAPEPLRGHRRAVVHRLHRLHAGDAVPAAVLPAARRHRRRRDRDVDGAEPRRHAGAHGAAGAVLGTPRRSLRPQDHGRAIARQLRRS